MKTSPGLRGRDKTEPRGPAWANTIMLLFWLAAGAVTLLPFAYGTSPLDAILLRVPGNQGNWWHFLAAAPFFLAYPMIWLRVRALLSLQPSTAPGRRALWVCAGLSVAGTLLVEMPFILHLAGTKGWPTLSMLSTGLGIIAASAATLAARRRQMLPTQACVAGVTTAWMANACLCVVVYASAPGEFSSRSGWAVTMVLIWPMALEVLLMYAGALRSRLARIAIGD
ncbi:MAG TPA: hypothetical protein VKR52_11980 [Terracidiphilus sp.]|nr:hypothetical protein [Terracidiphilus sp.]